MPHSNHDCVGSGLAAPAAATLADLEALMEKQEGLVLELAKEVEEQQALRCGITASDCQEMSYDNCGTRYPFQTCPASGLDIAACGDCGGLFDYTVTSVRLAESVRTDGDNNPLDDEVKETVCYTRHLESWLVSKNADNEATQVYGDRLPQMYFGGHNGAFRSFPRDTASSAAATTRASDPGTSRPRRARRTSSSFWTRAAAWPRVAASPSPGPPRKTSSTP